ncbi:catalase [Corynebacterium sp. P5875]|uniref:Catalase n=1 Tax=Corynebacterium antarcticum TaxID=2800405 RepID=A0A9Q4CBV0_9CORY|nr:catalase [Corynebacterium antarcticum]MCX7537944.1 catalase [Corynebacterium antarcticum]
MTNQNGNTPEPTVDDIVSAGQCPVAHGSTTSLAGAPVPSENHSVTQGRQGSIDLRDFHLVEKLAHFNRERVPERVVHAKGSGAFGELTVTEDVSKYTCAALFQPGTVTPMLARFSTVAGEQGSADALRDVRGFSLKFYTTEGNYDLVGNNTPVFFIRDGIKFPDFIHSQKRMPGSGLQDWNMRWDFWTRTPESAHQVTYLMGDRGIPKDFRHMDGFGSHTYQWVNEAGERFWVKYHFKTRQGWETLADAEAAETVAANPDSSREDLYNAIENGDYPTWDVKVQIMPVDEAESYRFNPFDLTKTWSQKDYPLIHVGHFTLNRNPRNFFAQIEQAAFAPSNLVRGIGFSPDKMLIARGFAYADAHRYRVGANSEQLPVNRPVCPVNSYSKDGAMTYEFDAPEQPVYSPNQTERQAGYLDDGGETSGSGVTVGTAGDLGLWDSTHGTDFTRGAYVRHPEDDDFIQAGTLVREVMDDAARERLAGNIARTMDGITGEVEKRVYEYWTNVDGWLGNRVRELRSDASS